MRSDGCSLHHLSCRTCDFFATPFVHEYAHFAAGFFTQYLVIKAFVALTVDLVRGLTIFHMLVRFIFQARDATKRERMMIIIGIRRFDNPGWCAPLLKTWIQLLKVLAYLMTLTLHCPPF